jgi:hypothetical protein
MAADAVLAGASAANPWLGIGSSFAQGLGSSLGNPGGPSNAALRGDSAFDSSGWNVNFGAGGIESDRSQTQPLSEYMPYILVAAGLLVVWRMTRKR